MQQQHHPHSQHGIPNAQKEEQLLQLALQQSLLLDSQTSELQDPGMLVPQSVKQQQQKQHSFANAQKEKQQLQFALQQSLLTQPPQAKQTFPSFLQPVQPQQQSFSFSQSSPPQGSLPSLHLPHKSATVHFTGPQSPPPLTGPGSAPPMTGVPPPKAASVQYSAYPQVMASPGPPHPSDFSQYSFNNNQFAAYPPQPYAPAQYSPAQYPPAQYSPAANFFVPNSSPGPFPKYLNPSEPYDHSRPRLDRQYSDDEKGKDLASFVILMVDE
jgi:hypothetical protein